MDLDRARLMRTWVAAVTRNPTHMIAVLSLLGAGLVAVVRTVAYVASAFTEMSARELLLADFATGD
jgi:energy-converting hydrogenase Eha subunit C